MNHKGGGEQPRPDLDWDDEGVLPPVLSPDTEFVFQRMTEETLKAAGVEIDRRALDVGCGRAIDAAALARKGGILFGCEPSRIMLRKAREGLAKNGDRVRLVGSTAETLPFAGHSFQRVVCKGAIDHFRNPDRAVAEAIAPLRGRGLQLAGALQVEPVARGRHPCDMLLEDLASGEVHAIAEDRGSQARGCRLDGGLLTEIGENVRLLDADRIAQEAGSPLTANVVILGAASHRIPLKPASLLEAVKRSVPKKTIEINAKAFELGREAGSSCP